MAVAALALSILTLVWTATWSIWLHRKQSRSELTFTVRHYPRKGETGLFDMTVFVTNPGPLPTTVIGLWGDVRGSKNGLLGRHFDSDEFPVKLGVGETWSTVLKPSVLRQTKAQTPAMMQPRFRFVAVDATNRQHKSKWISVG